LQIMLVRLMGR